MTRATRFAVFAIAVAGLQGCFTPQTYVDPTFHRAGYESLQRLAQPVPVKVDVQFQRNGKPLPAVDGELRSHVERTLRATGVAVPATADTKATISVTGNNIADIAAAKAAGFKTGFTFGGAGSMVDDNYEFVCVYQANGQDKKYSYQHALHTAIGHTQRPAGLAPTTPADGFGKVVEDVILNFVKDLQDAGLLPKQ